MTSQPAIDEMVAFIQQKAPQTLAKLREDNVKYGLILKEGDVCGESDDVEELKVRSEVCLVALRLAISQCNGQFPLYKKKINDSRNLQLYGKILTTVGGASMFTSLSTNYAAVHYIIGALTLFGSLAPLVIENRYKTLIAGKSIEEVYAELVKLKILAEKNCEDLSLFTSNGFNVEGVSVVIESGNKLCQEINTNNYLIN